MKQLMVFLLIGLFVFSGSSAYANSKWFGEPDPKPIPQPVPIPTPVPEPKPVPPKVTVEYGVMEAYKTETLWYFKNKMRDYGNFDFYVDGVKVAVISLSYNKPPWEVRDSGSRDVGVAIGPAGWSKKEVWISYPSNGTPAQPPAPEPVDKYSKKMDHFNTTSWDGRGFSLILCAYAPKFDRCVLNDTEPMVYHGTDDSGGSKPPRHVYTIYNKKKATGTVKCYKGASEVWFKIQGTGIIYGECR